MPQIEKFFVEVIQLLREVEQILWHRATDHGGNHGVSSGGPVPGQGC